MLFGVFEGDLRIDGRNILARGERVGVLDHLTNAATKVSDLEWFGIYAKHRGTGYGRRALREFHAFLNRRGVRTLNVHNITSQVMFDMLYKEFDAPKVCIWDARGCKSLYNRLPVEPPDWIEEMFEEGGAANFPDDFPQSTVTFKVI